MPYSWRWLILQDIITTASWLSLFWDFDCQQQWENVTHLLFYLPNSKWMHINWKKLNYNPESRVWKFLKQYRPYNKEGLLTYTLEGGMHIKWVSPHYPLPERYSLDILYSILEVSTLAFKQSWMGREVFQQKEYIHIRFDLGKVFVGKLTIIMDTTRAILKMWIRK